MNTPRLSLDAIAIKNGTDKASSHPVKGHNYAHHYEKVFDRWRDREIKLLEIGVGDGASILTWLEYFSKAKVIGVDLVQGTNEWNTVGAKPAGDRYHFVYGDQSDPTFLKCFIVDYGNPPFDIIIDDGGHYSHQIAASFVHLWPLVLRGGVYCVEDIGCAYTPGSVHLTPGADTHQKLFHDIFDSIMTSRIDVSEMSVIPELVILTKG